MGARGCLGSAGEARVARRPALALGTRVAPPSGAPPPAGCHRALSTLDGEPAACRWGEGSGELLLFLHSKALLYQR